MSDQLSQVLAYAQENQARFLAELIDFVSIPSVSTDPAARPAVRRAADWAAAQLIAMGFANVQVFSTPGHPIVFGELLAAGKDKPTVLFYGHFDVQPAEPFELWETPPFSPTVHGENLFGRGASDMKGQIMVSLKAVEAWIKTGGLPINVKFILEGEEEIGSPNLEAFLVSHKEMLACDYAVNPDTGMIGADIPTITYGLRGLAYFEIRVSGAVHDLHSGSFGGAVHNPAQVLCELIAGMHDAQGRVTLPGFYDYVRPLEADERAEFARLPTGEDFYLKQTGAPALFGEAGYTPAERIGGRPTLEVNGLYSGYIGEGQKTVLPAKAMAKISMRLVPDQDPNQVHQQLLKHLQTHAPETIRWELLQLAGSPASITDRNLPAVIALSKAQEVVWGKRPLFKREGGSVPVVGQMQKILGVESVLTGFGLPDDNVHAPNEKLHLPTFFRGISTFIHFFANLSKE